MEWWLNHVGQMAQSVQDYSKTDRIKALIWEGDGFLLCYKRLEQKASKFQWPRSQEEVCKLTSQQFRWLMEGLTIQPKKCIQKIDHPRFV